MKSSWFCHVTKSVLQQISALSISMDMALRHDLSLIPKLCSSSGASRSDSTILRISCLKPALATNMFASQRGCSLPARIITLRAEPFKESSGSSARYCKQRLNNKCMKNGGFPLIIRNVQPAVNRQPDYRWGTRRARYCFPRQLNRNAEKWLKMIRYDPEQTKGNNQFESTYVDSGDFFERRHHSDEVLLIHSSSPNVCTDMPPR